MARKKLRYCPVCNAKLDKWTGTPMMDEQKGEVVYVCRSNMKCQKPFLKVVNHRVPAS